MTKLSPKQRLQLERGLQEVQSERTNLRSRDRSLNARTMALKSQPLISDKGELRSNLSKILPKHLMPQNVGHYNEVMWPFFFPFDFDLGANPTYDSNTRSEVNVQVDQEAGFLLTHISRDHTDPGQSGYHAPIQVSIRDLQSSRQFNDEAVPIQQFGFKAQATYLDTPLFFAANARMQIVMTSWIPVGSQFATLGSGEHQIVLGGYRIRQKDAGKVLASIFM
jgi:hypothetical protein